jgi:hypothetical protein
VVTVSIEDVSLPLDFAVRLLERDGLRIPPFDVHGEGDSSLRSLGLDSDAWTCWVLALVRSEQDLISAASALEVPLRPSFAADQLAEKIRDYERPWALFEGDGVLRDRIADLWEGYRDEGMRWRHAYAMTPQHDRLAPEHERRLRRTLDRLGGESNLLVLVVRYSAPVVMVIPPDMCVVGRVEHDRGGLAFSEQLETGARELAATHAAEDG